MNEEDIKDNDELEVEVEESEEETPKAEAQVQDDVSGQGLAESDEQPKKSSKFQKRIDDLVHKQREAERQRDEYYKVAQKVMDENNSLRKKAQEFSTSSVTEMEARIEADMEKAKADYKKAYEEGDSDRLVEAQERMFKATSKVGELDSMKRQAAPENYKELDPIAPPPDQRAVEWASKNSWFNKDSVMTNAAYAIHDEVVKSGVEVSSDAYYNAIDRRMREEFPHKFQDEAQDTPSSNRNTIVTPGGNESGRSKKVRLSPSQVAVAKRLGVPLEEYAKQFVALDK
tara:strand:+ start:8144 stop:9001 length:858 start_codon:yes stop_codon:yes gene_type:complete